MTTETYFKNHSDRDLALAALEQLKFNKQKKSATNPKAPEKNAFFQELTVEIVNRFIEANK